VVRGDGGRHCGGHGARVDGVNFRDGADNGGHHCSRRLCLSEHDGFCVRLASAADHGRLSGGDGHGLSLSNVSGRLVRRQRGLHQNRRLWFDVVVPLCTFSVGVGIVPVRNSGDQRCWPIDKSSTQSFRVIGHDCCVLRLVRNVFSLDKVGNQRRSGHLGWLDSSDCSDPCSGSPWWLRGHGLVSYNRLR